MKKYTDSLRKLDSTKLQEHATKLKSDIVDIKKGIKVGDIQNPKTLMLKKRELARTLTLLNQPIAETTKTESTDSKKSKKESK